MKKGCSIALVVLVGFIALIIYVLPSKFDPEYDKVEIKQNIGGTLICNSVYNADHQSWQYNVAYDYKINDTIINIGSGVYEGREWNKDEQLTKYKNRIILKTGDWIGTDKIIVGNLKTPQWIEYKFTPESIEKDSLWQVFKIPSLLNYCCSETFVDTINDGQIKLNYKFRVSENLVNKYDQKKIYYLIDDASGKPVMWKVE